MKFLLDTNFLLAQGEFKLDIFSELKKFGLPELYTLDLVVEEIKFLAGGKGRDARNSKLALRMIEEKNIKILKSEMEKTDFELERLSKEGYVVCTQDKKLAKRLVRAGNKVISVRQKRYLEEFTW